MDMSQYLDIFLDEGREQLAALESNVLNLEEGNHSADILQIIFRAAHTLKGSSRTMGFMGVGELTHEMENVLDDLRAGKITVTTPIVNVLLECIDTLNSLIDSIATRGSDIDVPGCDVPALVVRLNELRSIDRPSADASASAPASVVAPIADTTESSPDLRLVQPIVPSDSEIIAMEAARSCGCSLHQVDIVLSADCLMKSVRVQMVIATLEKHGAILAASPSMDKLDAEEFDSRFAILTAMESTLDAVETDLSSISEIESISIMRWEPSIVEDASTSSPAASPELAENGPKTMVQAAAEAQNIGANTVAQPAKSELKVDSAPSSTEQKMPAPARVQTIRVDVSRLDKLLNLVGELVMDRAMIDRVCEDLHEMFPHDEKIGHLQEATQRLTRVSGELQDEIMKTRMLPIDGVFQRMPRMVRDLALKSAKEIDLQISGGETELDRSMLEVLADPLIHLLRNSVDHGVESPQDRLAAGKPAVGVVTLSARHEENHIVIEISDDGGGIDPDKMRKAAVSKGVLSQSAADAMPDRDAIHLIFMSGFSTAKVVSDVSGRGVGMDIVKSNIEKIGGRIAIESQVGRGSQFTIRLPLTLAIVRALLVSAGDATYVLPLGNIVEMLRLGDSDDFVPLRSVDGQGVILLRGRTVPLASLSEALAGNAAACRADMINRDAYVVVIGSVEKQIGLCVDTLLGEHEVVVKSLGTMFGNIRGLSGATILGDGRVALIIDAARILEYLSEISRDRPEFAHHEMEAS